MPGLHDCHLHFLQLGRDLERVYLFEVPSIAEAQRRLAERAATLPEGSWLLGRGWVQDVFAEQRFPTRHDLDAAVSDRPVALRHKSGHACWVNSRALQIAGLDAATADPEGGVYTPLVWQPPMGRLERRG